ncbi:methylated-DNA--[protein]-cysteine S-methyltransferase [Paenibacillus massiliensis]|uniref:methylated-DNA--[protein]-cysteine S-methyltransferase n=1 Tax=Paenibacillus massiliensis TaxID=225917 RepID=UPI00037DC5CB|nr:methylated-DNA--[protein]-cysteine S-methyltransferase [Paenibacillus massiliensis]
MMNVDKLYYESPLGVIEIQGTEEAVLSIMFVDDPASIDMMSGMEGAPGALQLCAIQLDEYFKGQRQVFTIPYRVQGTEFQQKVWTALGTVGYAETCSYQDIADQIGNTKANRAVGHANGKNRLSIIIPCHRVIGSNRKLTGYAGGLWRKEWLLQHEQSFAYADNTVSTK